MKFTIEYNARRYGQQDDRWNYSATIEAPTRRSAMARFRAQSKRVHDKLATERGYEKTRFFVRFSGINPSHRIAR